MACARFACKVCREKQPNVWSFKANSFNTTIEFYSTMTGTTGATIDSVSVELTSTADAESALPAGVALAPITPNPAHGTSRVRFALPVTDVDRVTVRYASAFALMHDLRRMGAGNPLVERRRTPLRRATLMRMAQIYAERFADPDGRMRATFDIVWLSGWAPHASQQQPLRPGSAKARLADALGTIEIPGGEKARPRTLVTATISITGVAVIVGGGIGGGHLAGDLTAIAMTFLCAVYLVMVRTFRDTPVVWAAAVSALLVFPAGWLITDPMTISAHDAVIVSIFGCSFAAAVILWTEGARLLPARPEARVLIFTAENEMVYRISEQFLIPAITHETPIKERKQWLDAFNRGEILALATSKVLNEGVNIPEAAVAIILSGSGSTREHIQRLGRILRKQPDKEAVLYEVVTSETTEEHISQRRSDTRQFQSVHESLEPKLKGW